MKIANKIFVSEILAGIESLLAIFRLAISVAACSKYEMAAPSNVLEYRYIKTQWQI